MEKIRHIVVFQPRILILFCPCGHIPVVCVDSVKSVVRGASPYVVLVIGGHCVYEYFPEDIVSEPSEAVGTLVIITQSQCGGEP